MQEDDDPEEEVEFLGKAPKKKETRVSYFRKFILKFEFYFWKLLDPPLGKPTKKFHPEDKKEGELLR